MDKVLVGKVTEQERDEIKFLFERKSGLTELVKCLTPENSSIYEKLVMDFGKTTIRFNDWWDNTSKKYQWSRSDKGHWTIDFESCNIYLIIDEAIGK